MFMFRWLVIITQEAIQREFCIIWTSCYCTVEHDLLASVTALADFLLLKTFLDPVEVSYAHLLVQACHRYVVSIY